MQPFDTRYAEPCNFKFSPRFGLKFGAEPALVLCALIHLIEDMGGEVILTARELHNATGIKGKVALWKAKERLRDRGIVVERGVGPDRSAFSLNEHLLVCALELA